MSFKIKLNEPLGESIRSVTCAQIDAAIAASHAEQKGKSSRVHETRKHLKKARSALRLIAADAPKFSVHRADRSLRKVGRLISEIRDAEVRLSTVKQMRNRSDLARGDALRETEELLAFELDSFLAAFDGWQDQAMQKLDRAKNEIRQWSLQDLDAGKVGRSLQCSYKRGRRALEAVREKGSAPRFHELRKQAKILWYQLRLLRRLDPSFHQLDDELKKIGERLGHAHDLCFLAERLSGIAGAAVSKRGSKALEALINSREEDMQRMAFRQAERFYAAKPKEFAAEIARRLHKWKLIDRTANHST